MKLFLGNLFNFCIHFNVVHKIRFLCYLSHVILCNLSIMTTLKCLGKFFISFKNLKNR